ncbi:DUF192 domain-containing protein [Pseudoalteromonas issachenkonii]|uniref:DUF192 domain-containing protein n=1 Tax=Pseudoalteromonas issachenkonii TaxID=152297 RepID=A0ABU9H4U7_9GAMM
MKYLTLVTINSKFNIMYANTWFLRLRGLLGRNLKVNEGMLIEPCNSVHTMWMKYDLDIIYINKNNEIVKIIKKLKPWKLSVCTAAFKTLELPADTVDYIGLKVGDFLEFKKEEFK